MGAHPESSRRPRELALFAGAGGGCLGSQLLGWRTVGYVEKDEFCVDLLKQRIEDGWLDDVRGCWHSGGEEKSSSPKSAKKEDGTDGAEYAAALTPDADVPAPLKRVSNTASSTVHSTQEERWPTPTANDAKNSTLPPSQEERGHIPGKLLRMGCEPGSIMNPRLSE